MIRAPKLMHGKLSRIHHGGKGVFDDVPDNFEATRYHSLIVERDSLAGRLTSPPRPMTASSWAFSHKKLNVHGVQFHPESIASEHGHKLLKNFLDLARSG